MNLTPKDPKYCAPRAQPMAVIGLFIILLVVLGVLLGMMDSQSSLSKMHDLDKTTQNLIHMGLVGVGLWSICELSCKFRCLRGAMM